MFILDRETGKPIYGVKEVPAPQRQCLLPGDSNWPTQPMPVKPPPLGTRLRFLWMRLRP